MVPESRGIQVPSHARVELPVDAIAVLHVDDAAPMGVTSQGTCLVMSRVGSELLVAMEDEDISDDRFAGVIVVRLHALKLEWALKIDQSSEFGGLFEEPLTRSGVVISELLDEPRPLRCNGSNLGPHILSHSLPELKLLRRRHDIEALGVLAQVEVVPKITDLHDVRGLYFFNLAVDPL